jgi:hypothetical protein
MAWAEGTRSRGGETIAQLMTVIRVKVVGFALKTVLAQLINFAIFGNGLSCLMT